MPRFDPPHYLFEHGDTTRLREAQHALVNARGNYVGAVPGLGATAPSAKDAIKANKAKIQAEVNKVVPNLIVVNNDGTLRVNDPISAIDRNIAAAFPAAIKEAIDALPLGGPNARALKTKLKTRPLTFFLDFFDPALDVVRGALEATMTRGLDNTTAGFKNKTTKDTGRLGFGGFVYDLSTVPLPGLLNNANLRNINVWLVQPGDELFDANSQRLILRLRMVLAYIVLFFKKPVELQAALLRAGLDALFGEDATLVRVGAGGDGSSFDKPRIVSSMPMVWRSGSDRKQIPAGPFLISKYTSGGLPSKQQLADVTKLVWEIPQDNRRGQTRSFVQLTQQSWDSWRRWHAQLINIQFERHRPIGGLSGFGALGAGEEVAAAKTAGDVATPVAAPTLLDQILSFFAGLAKVLGAVSAVLGSAALLARDINKPAVEKEKTEQAKLDSEGRQAEADAARAQSASSGISPLLIGGAVLAALFIFGKGRT